MSFEPKFGARGTGGGARHALRQDAARRLELATANTDLNCFIGLDPDLAMLAAEATCWRAHDGQAPLAGLALAVKDNIDLEGVATSAGTPALSGSIPAATAAALRRVLDAGAWVLGKTNMHELAFGVTGRNAAFGFVGNPRDRARSAGGSSGGSAAAVAADIVEAALGTDTGGSLRVPASFCGVVGFRPSTGRYASTGVVPLAAGRDTLGPLATNVNTAARLDACMAGEPHTLPALPPTLALGVPRGFLTDDLDPLVDGAWRESIRRLTSRGHRLVDVDVPGLWNMIDRSSPVLTAFELRRDFGTRILSRAQGSSPKSFVDRIASPDVRTLFELIVLRDGAPPEDGYRQVCSEVLPLMRTAIMRVFEREELDAWIFPTVPFPAFPLDADRDVLLNGVTRPLFRTTVRNLQQASLIGMPSISLPMPVPSGALPCGLCIEGRPGSDRRLLAVAVLVEAALGGAMRAPKEAR